jgi:hypothetical protein
VEIELEGRRVGLQKVAIVFYPPDSDMSGRSSVSKGEARTPGQA